MPVVQINCNVALTQPEKQELLAEVARLVAEVMEKPLADVMVALTHADFVMAGSFAPAAFINFRCLSGLQAEGRMARLCTGMCDVLRQYAPLSTDRVYVNFAEVGPEYAWRFRDGVAVCPKSALT